MDEDDYGKFRPERVKALKYFCMNHGDQRFFSILNHHKCLRLIFPLHLNTYVMGLQQLEIFSLLQCGERLKMSESDVYRRQILTTKVDPRAVRVQVYNHLNPNAAPKHHFASF